MALVLVLGCGGKKAPPDAALERDAEVEIITSPEKVKEKLDHISEQHEQQIDEAVKKAEGQ